MALYDYNPEVQSPQDNPDSELAFRKGHLLTVIGEMVRALTIATSTQSHGSSANIKGASAQSFVLHSYTKYASIT